MLAAQDFIERRHTCDLELLEIVRQISRTSIRTPAVCVLLWGTSQLMHEYSVNKHFTKQSHVGEVVPKMERESLERDEMVPDLVSANSPCPPD